MYKPNVTRNPSREKHVDEIIVLEAYPITMLMLMSFQTGDDVILHVQYIYIYVYFLKLMS